MKVAVFSDVHSNLEALEMAFNDMDNRDIDMRVCLGDIVGYGASVNEVVELVAEKTDIVVVGNHDKGVLGELDISGFNPLAKAATLWTRKVISEENLEYLRNLEYQICCENMLFTHASPYEPELFSYIVNEIDVLQAFDSFEEDICFTGHTHVHMVLKREDEEFFTRERNVLLDDIAIVNVGSIGQPRDQSALLSYAVYDTETTELNIIRLKYPVASSARKIIDAGLPEALAQRLFTGR